MERRGNILSSLAEFSDNDDVIVDKHRLRISLKGSQTGVDWQYICISILVDFKDIGIPLELESFVKNKC